MKKIVTVIILSLVSLFAMAEYFEINGNIPCASHDEVTSSMKKYEETPMWFGKVAEDTMALITVNPNTTSWTFMLTTTKHTCVISSGVGYSYRNVAKGTSL